MKTYKFSELSDIAKRKAVLDYQNGWNETHEHENLLDSDVTRILMDLEYEDEYNELGELQ